MRTLRAVTVGLMSIALLAGTSLATAQGGAPDALQPAQMAKKDKPKTPDKPPKAKKGKHKKAPAPPADPDEMN